MSPTLLQDVLIIFVTAIPVVIVGHRLGLPSVVSFLLTGALIGPFGLQFIESTQSVERLSEIGVALILFTAGLEFSLSSFGNVRRYGLGGGALQIGGVVLLGACFGVLNDWPLYHGIYFGCIMALSSTAIVLTRLRHSRGIDALQGQITTAILILQDIAVVPMIVLLPAFSQGIVDGGIWSDLLQRIMLALAIVGCVALFIRFGAEPFFRRITALQSPELFLITVITLAVGMGWLTQVSGLSAALGSFLGGLIVGSTRYHHQAVAEITPFRYCFNSIFFTSIGMLIDLDVVARHWVAIGALLVAIPCMKAAITAGGLVLLRLPLRLALCIGINLGQIGEFSFLLAHMGHALQVMSTEKYQLLVATAALSMMMTPMMMDWSPKLATWCCRLPWLRRIGRHRGEVVLKGHVETMRDHAIICGFGPIGERLGVILDQHQIPYCVLELNPGTVHRLHSEGRQVIYGDGASEELLFRSGLERARLLVITVPDFLNASEIIRRARSLSPTITIMTRAKYRRQMDVLREAGANVVVSEEDELGQTLARRALDYLDITHSGLDPKKMS
jgi:monovalent cation:H+ antiporter-2, CPA2 family